MGILGVTDSAVGSAQHISWTGYIPIALSCISICIALAAFTVALWNFRLSRFPRVRCIVKCETIVHHESQPPTTENRLEVEVESWGLPIWDMYAKVEAVYQRGEAEMGLLQVVMPPVGTRPQPMNPGQVAAFRVSREDIERGLSRFGNLKRMVGLSELPQGRIAIAIYGSGGRLIKRIGRDKYPYHFEGFERLKKDAPKEAIEMKLTSVNLNPAES